MQKTPQTAPSTLCCEDTAYLQAPHHILEAGPLPCCSMPTAAGQLRVPQRGPHREAWAQAPQHHLLDHLLLAHVAVWSLAHKQLPHHDAEGVHIH